MGEAPQPPVTDPLRLTPARRRLRVLTVLVLIMVIAMVVLGTYHPFFVLPSTLPAEGVGRRAAAVRALLVLVYWTACIMLGLSLMLIAWLDIRALRRALADARRRAWREVGTRSGERRDRGREP